MYRVITHGRILVADDNPDVAESTALLLQTWGHEARIARDGQDALNTTLSWMPDCCVLDLAMPKMTGMEVVSRIRKMGLTSELIRIVALTGHGYLASRRKALEVGFDVFLVKPCVAETLRIAIERGIERGRPAE